MSTRLCAKSFKVRQLDTLQESEDQQLVLKEGSKTLDGLYESSYRAHMYGTYY